MCFKLDGAIFTLNDKSLKIGRPFHIPQLQYLIYWKRCQHTYREDMNCYQQIINHLEI